MMVKEHTTISEKQSIAHTTSAYGRYGALLILLMLLILAIMLAVSFGSTAVPLTTIAQIVLNGSGLFHFARSWEPSAEVIIWQVRMPIVIGAVFVGAALAVAGALFQGLFRNPLADPYLIGTSSGAALGAALAFILPFDTIYGSFFPLTTIFAFIGAMTSVLVVYSLARSGGQTPVVTLLLAGVVVNTILVAIQTLLLTLLPHDQFGLAALFSWLTGGISVINWPPILIVGGIILICIVFALRFSGLLDVLALGEERASSLGIHVERRKFLIVIVASLLTAAAVSISGLIGFVGLVTPHIMRLLLGPKHRLLLPATALGGALFLTLADLLARVVIAPAVLPVGVFTALVGAPFFLFLLRRSKNGYVW